MPGPAIRIAQRAVAGFELTGSTLPPGATVTRAGPATLERGGRLTHVAAHVPRLTGAGLLLEPAATNHRVAAASVAGWSIDAGGGGVPPTVTAGAGIAPDGGPADRVLFARDAGYSRLTGLVEGLSLVPHVLSVWLRAETPGPGPALRVDGRDGPTLALTRAWQRFVLPFAPGGASASCQILLWWAIDGSPTEVLCDIWGAQVEAGSVATSLMMTGDAAATRAPEAVTLDWGRLGVGDGERRFALHLADGTILRRTIAVTGGRATIGALGPVPLARVLLD